MSIEVVEQGYGHQQKDEEPRSVSEPSSFLPGQLRRVEVRRFRFRGWELRWGYVGVVHGSGGGLGSASVTEPVDMLSIAESQVVGSAPVGEPAQLQLQFLVGGATRHEHYPFGCPTTESFEVLEDFFGIEDRSYHKL